MLAAGLHERGHRVDLVAFSTDLVQSWKIPEGVRLFAIGEEEATTARASFVRLRSRLGLHDGLRLAFRLARSFREARFLLRYSVLCRARGLADYIERERPDFIFPNLLGAERPAFLARRLIASRLPFIVPILRSAVGRHTKRRNQARRLMFPDAARVVAVSNGVAQTASSVLDMRREMFTTIYNPVVDGKPGEPPPPPPRIIRGFRTAARPSSSRSGRLRRPKITGR